MPAQGAEGTEREAPFEGAFFVHAGIGHSGMADAGGESELWRYSER
jgi:hypothetical protein